MKRNELKFTDTAACLRTISCKDCIYLYTKPTLGVTTLDPIKKVTFLASRILCTRLERTFGLVAMERIRGACGPTAKYYQRRK